MGEMRNSYNILVVKLQTQILCRRPGLNGRPNMEIYIGEKPL
jgi:hypothetical protein